MSFNSDSKEKNDLDELNDEINDYITNQHDNISVSNKENDEAEIGSLHTLEEENISLEEDEISQHNEDSVINDNKDLNNKYESFILKQKEIIQELTEENQSLRDKIEEQIKINKDWENKVNSISINFISIENENDELKAEKDNLNQKIEDLTLKLKCKSETDINKTNWSSLESLEKEYEQNLNNLKLEFKNKEENLRKKYEILEKENSNNLELIENNYKNKFEKLKTKLNSLTQTNENLELEKLELQQKLKNLENFFKIKEEEFATICKNKDLKLKELENSIKSISDEAKLQIVKMTDSFKEFNHQLNFYKEKELEYQKHINELENQLKSMGCDFQNEIMNNSNISKSRSNLIPENYNNDSDYLKRKIKKLEENKKNLQNELNKRYNEIMSLSEDLQNVSYEFEKLKNTHHIQMKRKNEEIAFYKDKVSQVEQVVDLYTENLKVLKQSYDQTVNDYENQLKVKNNELKAVKGFFEKKVKDLTGRLEDVLLKDNYLEKTKFRENKAIVKPLTGDFVDDLQTRKNIDKQINYIKEKLETHYLFK